MEGEGGEERGGKRGKERDRDRDTETHRETETQRQRHRERVRGTPYCTDLGGSDLLYNYHFQLQQRPLRRVRKCR